MYDYARSDTHFLLYIFDNLCNELLAKSKRAHSDGNLIDEVRDLSKREALQRYERQFYDATTGTGVFGWQSMLTRSAGRYDRQQFAVLRAIHEWRDKVARAEDESLQHILPNRAILDIATEMPVELPRLLSYCQPSHISTKKRAQELLELIKKAKAEGADGPEVRDLTAPRGHANSNDVSPLSHGARLVLDPTQRSARAGSPSNTTAAILRVSQFWGAAINIDGRKRKGVHLARTIEPHLALPLPPLTAEVFETRTTDDSPIPLETSIAPEARAEHQYTKKRKPQEEGVFVLKQKGGSKKRKTTEVQDGPEPVAIDDGTVNGDAGQIEVPLVELEGEEAGLTKSQQRRWRKRKLQEALQAANGDSDGVGGGENGAMEAFDYENAPSVLHAQKKNGGAAGAKGGIDPYSKSLDAPKGMRKVQKEGPGRSMTYKS